MYDGDVDVQRQKMSPENDSAINWLTKLVFESQNEMKIEKVVQTLQRLKIRGKNNTQSTI